MLKKVSNALSSPMIDLPRPAGALVFRKQYNQGEGIMKQGKWPGCKTNILFVRIGGVPPGDWWYAGGFCGKRLLERQMCINQELHADNG